MKRKSKRIVSHAKHHSEPIPWWPIDSRIILPLFRFSRVTGIARIFLQIEITLCVLVVLGTIVIVFLKAAMNLF